MTYKWPNSVKCVQLASYSLTKSSNKLKPYILDSRGLSSKDIMRFSKEDGKWLFTIWHLRKGGFILKENESEDDLTDYIVNCAICGLARL